VTAFRTLIRDVVEGVSEEFTAHCESLGYEPVELPVNALQVENHLVTRGLEKGSIKPDEVNDERGKRIREKSAEVLAGIFRRYPDAFAGQVATYCDGKLSEAKAELAKAAEGVPAEEVSQEEVIGEGDDAVVIERQGVSVG
jgi:hypothetical protein